MSDNPEKIVVITEELQQEIMKFAADNGISNISKQTDRPNEVIGVGIPDNMETSPVIKKFKEKFPEVEFEFFRRRNAHLLSGKPDSVVGNPLGGPTKKPFISR